MHVWSNIILITKVSNRTVIIIVGDFYIREYYKPGQSKFFELDLAIHVIVMHI